MIFQDVQGIPHDKKQFKGNLHSHTVNSDGCLTPEEDAELFRSHGYSFLCLSEHDKYTDYRKELDTQDFIILPGLEASANLMDSRWEGRRIKTHHMHGILGNADMQAQAVRHFINGEVLAPKLYHDTWDGRAAAQNLCDTLHAHGCIVTYNHPLWSRVRPEEFMDTDGIFALEIYNYNTVNESANGTDTTYWDLMLSSGKNVYAFASDDNHNEGKFDDACGGWVVVSAESLTQENIINALCSGAYYSSSGPEIFRWEIRNGRAAVECSACERVNFIAGGDINAGTCFIAPTRDGLHHAEYVLRGDETYVRAECIDYAGKKAWTNAIFLNI